MGIFGWMSNKEKAREWIEKGDQAKDLKEKYNCYVKATEIDPGNSTAWFHMGYTLADLGKHQEAIQAYERVTKIDPNGAAAWNNMGISLSSLGRHEEALMAFERAIQIDPNHKLSWYNKGSSLANLGRHAEAVTAYEKTLNIDPNYKFAIYRQGIAYAALGKYVDAIHAYERALEIDPNFVPAWNELGKVRATKGTVDSDYKEAIEAFDKAIQLNPKYQIDWGSLVLSLIKHADKLAWDKKYDEALKASERAIRIAPNDAGPWYSKGYGLERLERYEEALEAFNKATEIKPDSAEYWHEKGYVLNLLKRYEEAIDAFDRAIKIKPLDNRSWNNKAHSLKKLHRYEEAIDALDVAIEAVTYSDTQKADHNRITKCFYLQQKGEILSYYLHRHEEAIAVYERVIAIDPSISSGTWSHKGVALSSLGRHKEAIRAYDQGIAGDPTYSWVWVEKGKSLSSLGRHEEATRAYDKAIAISPTDAHAWAEKGKFLSSLKRHEEATRAYDKAIAIEPTDAQAWTELGQSLSSLGRHEEALKAYEKVLELTPTDAHAWVAKATSLMHLGKSGEANATLDKAIAIDPKCARAWCEKGNALVNLGRPEDAVRAYERAIDLNPDCGHGWFNKGKVLHDIGRYEESLAAYKRAAPLLPDNGALGVAENKCRTMLLRSMVTVSFNGLETNLEYNIWQLCTLTVTNTCTKQLNNITLSFSGDVEARGIRPVSLSPSEQKIYECSLKALARGTVPVEITVTAEDTAGEKYSTTYDYSISVSDPQRSAAPLPASPAIAKQIFSSEMFPLERTVYDPVLQDFLVSSERPLINVRRWIEDRDPGSYWCVICIHNDSDSPIDEWGIELNATSSLQVIDACIEGYGESATVRESHPMPWLSQWVIGVSHHAGIVIPRNGSRRIYVKLGSNACGVSHTIKGRFMTSHGVEVPIREKTFTHSCDIATLRTAPSSDPAAAGQYAEISSGASMTGTLL